MSVYEPLTPQALDWVLTACAGASILATERLFGGLTAAMDRIVMRDRTGDDRHVVLRRWTHPWPGSDQAVEREAAALRAVSGHDIGAPELIATDPTGAAAGVRSLVMSEVPGQVLLTPEDPDDWLDQMAERQARIHQIPASLDAESPGWFNDDADIDYDWIDDPGLRREALEAAASEERTEQQVLRHGDYQHFNLLWSNDGDLTGVVDWTEGGIGPRGNDVGHCRLNLAVLFSADAADLYLDAYEATAELRVDRNADLRGLLAWQPGWVDFIPAQVAGRADLDLHGMRGRVLETIRRNLRR